MPAVNVEDRRALPVVRGRSGSGQERVVVARSTAPAGTEGAGFPVRRSFAGIETEALDPFVHMDQMGPVVWPPGAAVGTPWHPHRGFETVTYLLDGVIRHQDSAGGGGVIRDGGTQWMTAGAGLLHIEAPPPEVVAAGGLFHGVQLWVNLPATEKSAAPRYQDIPAEDLALGTDPDRSSLLRVIAGTVGDVEGPGTTHTPIVLVHATIDPGAVVRLLWPADHNALVYALLGAGAVGDLAPRELAAGQLAVLGDGDEIVLRGPDPDAGDGSTPLDVLVLGGRPIREPVVQMGPFVMNTREEILQAFADFEAGRMGRIPD